MNPHFIFNVLNGLQSALILKSDREISHYIGQLSGLLRMTLDVSKRESISLTEEIEYLKSYVELQRIRLNDRMDYCFDLSRNIEASKIFIPPLLIQPLVENAILHGITPSKNKGSIWLSIKKG
jgi:sensor histidine kinase YesM